MGYGPPTSYSDAGILGRAEAYQEDWANPADPKVCSLSPHRPSDCPVPALVKSGALSYHEAADLLPPLSLEGAAVRDSAQPQDSGYAGASVR